MAVLAALLGAVVMGVPTSAQEDGIAGSQGVDTSLPPTDSQVTVAGRAPFSDLRITLNQTRNLTDQAISLSWSGGQPTARNGRTSFAGNFLQVMQCWGDDDGQFPENPGPPPEQCVAGATTALYEGRGGSTLPAASSTQRRISLIGDETYDPTLGYVDGGENVWRVFRAADGTVIGQHVNSSFNPFLGGNYWLNPYFDVNTTNEVVAAPTRRDGSGVALFQVLTGIQSTGLGCGQKLPAAGGGLATPRCWLVVVPRATAEEENAGTLFAADAAERGVSTSPLSERAWANRIAIPLEFNPVDSPCERNDDERRLAGNELVASAVASWQPLLCGNGKPPYSYAPVTDATARQILINPRPGSAGMVTISRPLAPELTNPTNPLVYAPVAASGLAIGFNVERIPSLTASPEMKALVGVAIADINLTPRLVAKLLTQSYSGQVNIYVPPDYPWVRSNPRSLERDPDFLRFNPEFNELLIFDGRLFSGLQLPPSTSDAARQVWEWILSDSEAAAWLNGESDEWGMRVNPQYATDAALNPSGFAFGTPIPELFPKADPYCFVSPSNGVFTPPVLCGTDWMPYARGFDEAALRVRLAGDSARLVQNPFAQTQSAAFSRVQPQVVGTRAILGLTDTASAARYGLRTARLSRAGDDGDQREFVKADADSLLRGLATMKARSESQVLEPVPKAEASGAYPLTSITYAATLPLTLDEEARAEYAAFLRYVVGPGQRRGQALGQLPAGYIELPSELVAQSLAASETILTLQPQSVPPPPVGETLPAGSLLPPVGETVPAGSPLPPSPFPPAATSSTGGSTVSRSGAASGATGLPSAPSEPVAPPESGESASPSTTGTEAPTQAEAEKYVAPVATTPAVHVGAVRIATPVLGGLALLSALAAIELTKRPRRSVGGPVGAGADAAGGKG